MIDFHTHIFPPNFPNYNKKFNTDIYIYLEGFQNQTCIMYKGNKFRYECALIKNSQNKFFLCLINKDMKKKFMLYLKKDGQKIVCWLNSNNLKLIENLNL